MNTLGKILPIAATCIAFSMPGFAQDEPNIDTVIATVNETKITLGHVMSLASRLPEQYLEIPNKDLYEGIVDQLVQQQLLSNLIDTETKEMVLAGENEQRARFATEAIEKLYETAINEDIVLEQYNTIYAQAEAISEFHASHILVKTQDEATAVVTELNDGKDFAELAKEKSTGPSGPQGGDLGWAGKGSFVPEFEAVMIALKAGEVSAPVETQFGWHVIRLNETRDKPVPELSEVRAEIEDNIRSTALEQKISELQSQFTVKRNELAVDPATIKKFEMLK